MERGNRHAADVELKQCYGTSGFPYKGNFLNPIFIPQCLNILVCLIEINYNCKWYRTAGKNGILIAFEKSTFIDISLSFFKVNGPHILSLKWSLGTLLGVILEKKNWIV